MLQLVKCHMMKTIHKMVIVINEGAVNRGYTPDPRPSPRPPPQHTPQTTRHTHRHTDTHSHTDTRTHTDTQTPHPRRRRRPEAAVAADAEVRGGPQSRPDSAPPPAGGGGRAPRNGALGIGESLQYPQARGGAAAGPGARSGPLASAGQCRAGSGRRGSRSGWVWPDPVMWAYIYTSPSYIYV